MYTVSSSFYDSVSQNGGIISYVCKNMSSSDNDAERRRQEEQKRYQQHQQEMRKNTGSSSSSSSTTNYNRMYGWVGAQPAVLLYYRRPWCPPDLTTEICSSSKEKFDKKSIPPDHCDCISTSTHITLWLTRWQEKQVLQRRKTKEEKKLEIQEGMQGSRTKNSKAYGINSELRSDMSYNWGIVANLTFNKRTNTDKKKVDLVYPKIRHDILHTLYS